MRKIILGIHGLANKPKREELKSGWQKAILEGLEKNCEVEGNDVDFRMVYWADLLYKSPRHNDSAFSFDNLFNEEPYLEAIEGTLRVKPEKMRHMVRSKLLGFAGAGVEAFRSKFGDTRLSEWLLNKVVRDLAFYYDENRKVRGHNGVKASARTVLDTELKQELLEAHGDSGDVQIMLIAHSMGSIISYNVLRHIKDEYPNFKISHFVTIGSPLGLPFVRAKIREERGEVRTPTVVTESWINYADPKDPVSADICLQDDYGVNDHQVQVVDDFVWNSYRGLSGESNHHKSYGYLRTPEMSKHIKNFLD